MTMEKWFKEIKNHPLGILGGVVVALFIVVGIYAPFFAASKPLVVVYQGEIYFPLFRYLFFSGYYTKPLDLFFNVLMFTFPFFFLTLKNWRYFFLLLGVQGIAFLYLLFVGVQDPASDRLLTEKRQAMIQESFSRKQKELIPEISNLSWDQELNSMNTYAKLNLVIHAGLQKEHHEKILVYGDPLSSRFGLQQAHREEKKKALLTQLQSDQISYLKAFDFLETLKRHCSSECRKHLQKPLRDLMEEEQNQMVLFERNQNELMRISDEENWLKRESQHVHWMIMPFFRPFHWEEDAGGGKALNQKLPWWELTRSNRKDLAAALIFGIRVSLVVGFLAVFLAFLIGVPIGSLAGYYGGVFDIIVSRLLEVWESMPTFFMLLFAVGILQNKSIFIVILIIGIFGWTGFSRYIRGEFFKQRSLAYVEASRAIGFSDRHIIFKHILPNAIPPLWTLLPFAIMGAISSEAGLSFLGLGEEGSCSWGVLMDEGRNAFPAEAYLLWPPAILLIILLVAIALIGDALRDILDPKLK